jgi:hypothetical protein
VTVVAGAADGVNVMVVAGSAEGLNVMVVAARADGVNVTVTALWTEGVKVEVTVTVSRTADDGLPGTMTELRVVPRTEDTCPIVHDPKSFWQLVAAQ